ncbi:MAG TPA: DUF2490 domain-containing protein [Terriglobia bacterium]|nr:DUF2490 domain-containing protein [Terriglobia bacterium]
MSLFVLLSGRSAMLLRCTLWTGVTILVLSLPARTQDRQVEQNVRVWFPYFGDHLFGDSRWGLHLEAQARLQGITQINQLVLRPGVNYQANRSLMLTTGYAYVRLYPSITSANPVPPRNEHRIWEQAWFRYGSGRVAWSTRLRFENRFIEGNNGQYRFENRVRVWQQATVPLSQRVYATGYDEVWFHVKPYQASSAFNQNRAYAALGFRLKPGWRLETGYMNQVLLVSSGRVLEVNHIVTFSVLSTATFRRK